MGELSLIGINVQSTRRYRWKNRGARADTHELREGHLRCSPRRAGVREWSRPESSTLSLTLKVLGSEYGRQINQSAVDDTPKRRARLPSPRNRWRNWPSRKLNCRIASCALQAEFENFRSAAERERMEFAEYAGMKRPSARFSRSSTISSAL